MAGIYQPHHSRSFRLGRKQLGGSATVLRPSERWRPISAGCEPFLSPHIQRCAIHSLPEQTVLVWRLGGQCWVCVIGSLDSGYELSEVDDGWPAIFAIARQSHEC